MNKTGPLKLTRFILSMLLPAMALIVSEELVAQGYLDTGLRNTNCPVASHEADRWYFGQNAGLDFRSQNPVADLSNFNMNVPNSPAIISDSLGNVLFFTDGIKVWNRLQGIMPNGQGLGLPGYTQPVIIIPKPGSNDIYYIFTSHVSWGIEFNEVNLSLDGGLGDVAVKNKQLLPPPVSSKLTAVKHSNGVDYWVVTHKFNSREFCSFRITSDGVDSNCVSSIIGSEHTALGTNNEIGYMKISPDGKKLALAITGSNIFEMFDFNPTSGTIPIAITSPSVFYDAFGVEFSSDSRYLYGSTVPTSPPQPNLIPPSYIFQFDTDLGTDVFSDYDTIAGDTSGSYFGGMQLGTDGRIYVSRYPYGNAAISVINNPKRQGLACNFEKNALDLGGNRSRLGLPNFIQSYFNLPHFDVEFICYSDTTRFTLQNYSNIDNILWNFGDTASMENSSTDFLAEHTFSAPGIYTVEVTEYFDGIAYGPYYELVIVNEVPYITMPDTVYMYPGNPVLLDAGEGFTSYEWWPSGETTQIITVSEPGTYWATVQNEKCCFNSDSVNVVKFEVLLPNAFRPDGLNKIFKAYATAGKSVSNFTLSIYNRWGQQVFISDNIGMGWNGTYKGKDVPGDVYVCVVSYDIDREGRIERVTYRGNLVLIR